MITFQFNKLKTLFFAFLVLGGVFFVNQTNTGVLAIQEEVGSNISEPVLTALTNHDAIEISSDADPDLLLLPGNGSEFNPYVIENYYIEVTPKNEIVWEWYTSEHFDEFEFSETAKKIGYVGIHGENPKMSLI